MESSYHASDAPTPPDARPDGDGARAEHDSATDALLARDSSGIDAPGESGAVDGEQFGGGSSDSGGCDYDISGGRGGSRGRAWVLGALLLAVVEMAHWRLARAVAGSRRGRDLRADGCS